MSNRDGNAIHPAAGTRSWLLPSIICALGYMMITFDSTVVNIILPAVQTALGLGDADRQWTMAGYSLVFGSCLAIGGRGVDRLGARRAMIVGALGFGGFSAIAGMTSTTATLIAARAIQALFGTLLAPATLAILNGVGANFSTRARSFAMYGAVSAVGGPLGFLIGGLLTQHFSWRPCMWVNGGLGLLVALSSLAFLAPTPPAPAKGRMDVAGAVLITAGLAALLFGVSRLGAPSAAGSAAGLSGWDWVGLSVVALCLFVVVERRHPSPIIPLALFAGKARIAALVSLALVTGSFMGIALLMSFLVQQVLHYSPALAGLALLPSTFGAVLGPVLTGVLVPRIGAKRVWLLGAACQLAGGAILTRLGPDAHYLTTVMPGDFLAGLGLGLSLMPSSSILMYGVPRDLNGAAGALNNATMQISASLGATGFNAIFVAFATSNGGVGGYDMAFLGECAAAGLAVVLIATAVEDLPSGAALAGAIPVH